METKVVEVRDAGTFIPMLAIRVTPWDESEAESYLLSRAGWTTPDRAFVLLAEIAGGTGKITCDMYEWGQMTRTKIAVHDYLNKHWDEIEPGGVVDVEFILGTTHEPKLAERLELAAND